VKSVRIYQPGDYAPGSSISLSPQAVQHVSVVLRMKAGEKIIIFNDTNYEYQALILSADKKKVLVKILASTYADRESSLLIQLAPSICKGERMEWMVQKAVELGVTSIQPLVSERCVVKLDKKRMEKKQAQWMAIAISACEQCARNRLPDIHPAVPFSEFVQQKRQGMKFILNPLAEKNWREYSLTSKQLTLTVGPEGGFNESEITMAEHAGFSSLSMGPRILRAETAAITGVSLLQAVFGDL